MPKLTDALKCNVSVGAADEADVPVDCLPTWSTSQGVKHIFVNTVPVFCHLQVPCVARLQLLGSILELLVGASGEVSSDLASINSCRVTFALPVMRVRQASH